MWLPVLRTGALDAGMTVDYTTTNGSALAGSDYEAASGRLTFVEGQVEQTIALDIFNDVMPELTETFQVNAQQSGRWGHARPHPQHHRVHRG